MSDERKLNVVDEDGNIVGVETRENIHARGLLHREVHVWFYTPQGEIIFRHRAKDKDTFPDLLDATVGGHVEIGTDFEDTALKEVEEETGLNLRKDDLVLLKTDKTNSSDEITNKQNNCIRATYAYRYFGKIEDLLVEEGKAVGFESWPLDRILNVSDEDRPRFIPGIFEPGILETFWRIKNLLI
jgi:isopentenyldiphosphate isomerase